MSDLLDYHGISYTGRTNQPEQSLVDITKEAIDILQELCNLKRYKDEVGKDVIYNARQPELWDRANKFLNSIANNKQLNKNER